MENLVSNESLHIAQPINTVDVESTVRSVEIEPLFLKGGILYLFTLQVVEIRVSDQG